MRIGPNFLRDKRVQNASGYPKPDGKILLTLGAAQIFFTDLQGVN
jgi:hypothetical protein